MALKKDGTVSVWGDSLQSSNIPAGLSNVVAVAGGRTQSLALKNDGSVVAWGYDFPYSPRVFRRFLQQNGNSGR